MSVCLVLFCGKGDEGEEGVVVVAFLLWGWDGVFLWVSFVDLAITVEETSQVYKPKYNQQRLSKVKLFIRFQRFPFLAIKMKP